MAKTILVCGYGPGISSAVAEKFGKEGFSVGIVGRTRDKLDAGVKALEAKGIKAAAFTADVGDPAAARGAVEQARAKLGPVTVLQWSAYSGAAGDLLAADAAAVHGALDVATVGLLAAIRAALPDMKKDKESAVLVTNGGFGYFDPNVDAMCVQYDAMGLGMANAAKHKMLGMLAIKLKNEGVYVGEAMVLGTIKGTPFDQGQPGSIDGSVVAARFWEMYKARSEVTVQVK